MKAIAAILNLLCAGWCAGMAYLDIGLGGYHAAAFAGGAALLMAICGIAGVTRKRT